MRTLLLSLLALSGANIAVAASISDPARYSTFAGQELANSREVHTNSNSSYSSSSGTVVNVASAGADLMMGGIASAGSTFWPQPHDLERGNDGFAAAVDANFSFAISGPAGPVDVGIEILFASTSSLHEVANSQLTIYHQEGIPTFYDYSFNCGSFDGVQMGQCDPVKVLRLDTSFVYQVSMHVLVNTTINHTSFPTWSGGGAVAAVHPYFYLPAQSNSLESGDTPAGQYSLIFSPGFGNVPAAAVSEPATCVLFMLGVGAFLGSRARGFANAEARRM